MCGIALLFHRDGGNVDMHSLQRMGDALAHRGPDDQNIFVDGNVGLAHTRLSIVDRAGGRQPMTDPSGRYVISYNGELYNYAALRDALQHKGYVFRTASDTEVVLASYIFQGSSCLAQLRGMFSFVIFDRQTRRCFAARDRLGIKPLFYTETPQGLAAASEIKAIFATGWRTPQWHLPTLRNFFRYQFALPPATPFTGVFELPPGCFFEYDAETGLNITRYWDLQFPRDGDYESWDETYWAGRFTDALSDAAASHTIGEVPIGAYLSGGIDSATTTWWLKHHSPRPPVTFSIGFEDPDLDESPIIRRIASHLGVENHRLNMDEMAAANIESLQRCFYHLEQPQRMAVDLPHFLLSETVQHHHYKVVFTGDGADEIFGGYDCFRQDFIRISGNQQKNHRARRRYYLNEFSQWFAPDYLRRLWHWHRPGGSAV